MSLIASLIGPVSGILDKVIPDSDMKAKLAHEIATTHTLNKHYWPSWR